MKQRSPRIVPLLSVLAVALAACGGGSSDGAEADEPADNQPNEAADAGETDDEAVDDPPAGDSSADADDAGETEDPVVEDADAPGDTVETPDLPAVDEAPGDGASAATAAPLVGSQLDWTKGDAEWDLAFNGFVEVDRSNPEDGKCAALFGTATLASVEDGLWNTSTDQPRFGVLIGGEYVTPRNNGCNDDLNTSLGYRYTSNLNVVPGTSYPFVAQFQLDDINLADVEALVVGKENADVQYFFQPTALPAPTDVPAAMPAAGDVSGLGVQPLGVAVTDTSNGQIDVTVTGLVETEASGIAVDDQGPGRCVSITHTITANSAPSDGRPVTPGAPVLGILSGGQLLTYSGGNCVSGPEEAAGYQDDTSPRLTPGTSINRSTSVFVPDELDGGPAVVVVDSSFSPSALLFDIDLAATTTEFPAPAAPADASVLPASDGAMPSGPLSYDPGSDQTVWTIDVAGAVDGGLASSGLGQCWYVPMTLTASAEESLEPQMFVVSDGQANLTTNLGCGGSIMTDAGWESLSALDFSPDVATTGFATFNVPSDSAGTLQQLIVGSAPANQPTVVIDATVLDAVPAP